MPYAEGAVRQPPKTLTAREQKLLLQVTGEHRDGYRDHVMFSLALGTGLRELEISSLNVGDVYDANGKPKRIVVLKIFKGHAAKKAPRSNGDRQEVMIPDAVWYRLKKFYQWKLQNDEDLTTIAPLFCSARKTKDGSFARIATRTMLYNFVRWQMRAGFDRQFKFHHLRHTCATNIWRKTKDIRIVQRQLRHANINTSTIYAAPTDEDLSRAVRDLEC